MFWSWVNMLVLSGTHSVQNANFEHLTRTNSVNVTCFFAINAPASACMALFENSSFGLTFNGTVPHPPGSLLSSGFVSIPSRIYHSRVTQGLSSVVFDVDIYDIYDMDFEGNITASLAFRQREVLEIELDIAEPNPTTATYFTGKKNSNSRVTVFSWTKFYAETTASTFPSNSSSMEQNGKC